MALPSLHPPIFRQRNFPALWAGQLVSLLGERITYLALIGLISAHTHGFRDDRSSVLLSLLANVMLAPSLLFAPFVGAWLDIAGICSGCWCRRTCCARDSCS